MPDRFWVTFRSRLSIMCRYRSRNWDSKINGQIMFWDVILYQTVYFLGCNWWCIWRRLLSPQNQQTVYFRSRWNGNTLLSTWRFGGALTHKSHVPIIRQQITNYLNLVWEKIKIFPQDSMERGMRRAKLRRTPSCWCLWIFFNASSNSLNSPFGMGLRSPRSWKVALTLNYP